MLNTQKAPVSWTVSEQPTNLYAVSFDPGSLKTTGGQFSLVDGVSAGAFDVSNTGTLVYLPATSEVVARNRSTLVWVDRNGNEEPLPADPEAYDEPRISPDGKSVAVSINTDSNLDIYVLDIDSGRRMRVTWNEAADGNPIWVSDSKIAFASAREGRLPGVYLKSANGTGDAEKLGSVPGIGLIPYSLSADGKTLILIEINIDGTDCIMAVPVEYEPTFKPLKPKDLFKSEKYIFHL